MTEIVVLYKFTTGERCLHWENTASVHQYTLYRVNT